MNWVNNDMESDSLENEPYLEQTSDFSSASGLVRVVLTHDAFALAQQVATSQGKSFRIWLTETVLREAVRSGLWREGDYLTMPANLGLLTTKAWRN